MTRSHSLGAALAAGGSRHETLMPNQLALSRSGDSWCYQIIPKTDFTFNILSLIHI